MPWKLTVEPEPILPMQMVAVDTVIACGPRHFGWADTKSALTTLVSWLHLSNPVISGGTPGKREIQLDNERIRQFAKTIVGGMCRHDGSYQKTDDSALSRLEEWLRQSVMVSIRDYDWGTNADEHASVSREDWIKMPVQAGCGSDRIDSAYQGPNAVAPLDARLQKSPAARVGSEF